MSLRYSGPAGDYPVYTCRADRDQEGGPLCQEVRALPVDAHVESILLEARATGSGDKGHTRPAQPHSRNARNQSGWRSGL
ncbi:hypothetical protein [Mesorhizobium sp. M0590]|uniref:hypothetical protein n=1 Tax=Mesorhizobium sp. M0590 TaxID=2956966 RepID=UPI00333C1264